MSNWTYYVDLLRQGRVLQIRPKGQSMKPLINSGDLIEITPLSDSTPLEVGDAVFCKVKGHFFVHKITAIKNDQYQISNNHGHVNGWTSRRQIFGKITNNLGQ